jgi:hypothetical protein
LKCDIEPQALNIFFQFQLAPLVQEGVVRRVSCRGAEKQVSGVSG